MDETKEDPIDEAIKLFRINVLFKNFEIKGTGDKLLIYLTVLIQKIMEIIANNPKKEEVDKNLAKFAMEQVQGTAEGGFFMGGILDKPKNEAENTKCKEYMKHLKAETIRRITLM